MCGKELVRLDTHRVKQYSILVVDYNDCCFADIYSDGEVDIRFKAHSEVPKKHKKGGQSAARFGRIRDSEITKWFKRIDYYLKEVPPNIHLGISFVYQKRFLKTLSTENKDKITKITKTEYADITGIYQYINKMGV